MNTTPLNNRNSQNGKKNGKWTRAKIAAALAAGSITTEAANILYAQLDPEPEPEPETVVTPEQEPEQELEPEPEPEPETEPDQEPEPEPEPNPQPGPEPIPTTQPETTLATGEDIVDVIVEEIDPHDIDMEDILLVDSIGTLYTEDGRELNAAMIHDDYGNHAMIVDVDNDNVYDFVTNPENGEIIAEIPGDIDVSDVELLYAQQHGESGFLEQNDLDIALNNDNPDIDQNTTLA